jgi:acyl-CoA synthetase (AMP-forming)/AMP-acid ligase II
MAQLLHDLITNAAWKAPEAMAFCVVDDAAACRLSYGQLEQGMQASAQAFLGLGIGRGERVAILLDKRAETLFAMFGALAAGAAFLMIDAALDSEAVAAILRHSQARILVTTPGRRIVLEPALRSCPLLRCILQTGEDGAAVPGLAIFSWNDALAQGGRLYLPRVDDAESVALIYTRSPGGAPRAMALSHCGMLDYAAKLVARLGERAQHRSLALLPISDGCNLGLLASTFAARGEVVAINQVMAREVPGLVAREQITSLAAQPWLWMQVAGCDWVLSRALRSVISVGGTLPRPTLDALQRRLPLAQVFLMHMRQVGGGDMLVEHPGMRPEHALPVS